MRRLHQRLHPVMLLVGGKVVYAVTSPPPPCFSCFTENDTLVTRMGEEVPPPRPWYARVRKRPCFDIFIESTIGVTTMNARVDPRLITTVAKRFGHRPTSPSRRPIGNTANALASYQPTSLGLSLSFFSHTLTKKTL
jgi:hypothetical protein